MTPILSLAEYENSRKSRNDYRLLIEIKKSGVNRYFSDRLNYGISFASPISPCQTDLNP